MGVFDKINNDPNDDIILANEVAQLNKPVTVKEIVNRAHALLEERDIARIQVRLNPDNEEFQNEMAEAEKQYDLYLSKFYVSPQ